MLEALATNFLIASVVAAAPVALWFGLLRLLRGIADRDAASEGQ